MSIDYQVGLLASILISFISASIFCLGIVLLNGINYYTARRATKRAIYACVIIASRRLNYSINKRSLSREINFSFNLSESVGRILPNVNSSIIWAYIIMVFGAVVTGFGVAVFILVFTCINTLYNPAFHEAFNILFSEKDASSFLSSGDLPLRISSVILGLSAVYKYFDLLNYWGYSSSRNGFKGSQFINIAHFFRDKVQKINNNLPILLKVVNYPEIKELSAKYKEIEIKIINLHQLNFYIFVFLALWIFLIGGHSTWATASANWLTFFIIDDWAIISDTFVKLKGRSFGMHKARMLCSNIVLFFACFFGFYNWNTTNAWIFFVVTFLLVFSLLLRVPGLMVVRRVGIR